MMQRMASSQTSRLVSISRSKPPSSVIDAGFAGAELDPAVRYQVEAGDALGDALRRVGGELHDAMAQPDVLGALAGGAEEHLGRRRVRILLQEVVLDLPCVVVAKPIGQFDLRQRILIQRESRPPMPRLSWTASAQVGLRRGYGARRRHRNCRFGPSQ